MANLFAIGPTPPPNPTPSPSPSQTATADAATTTTPIPPPIVPVPTRNLYHFFLRPHPNHMTILNLVTMTWVCTAFQAWKIWCIDGRDDPRGPGHFGIHHSFVPLWSSIGAWIGSAVGRSLDAGRVGLLWATGIVLWLLVVYNVIFYAFQVLGRPFIHLRNEIVPRSATIDCAQRVAAHATLHSIVALLFHFGIWNRTVGYPTLWGWIKFIKLDQPILQHIVYGSLAVGFILGAADITVVELAMLPLTLPIRLIAYARRMEEARFIEVLARKNAGVKEGKQE
ncbi:hypothetical protein RQP46_008209 [Phenoliferia psychrophenolica]